MMSMRMLMITMTIWFEVFSTAKNLSNKDDHDHNDNDDDNDYVEDNDDGNDYVEDNDNDQFVHLWFEVLSAAKNFSYEDEFTRHCPSNQLAHHLGEIMTFHNKSVAAEMTTITIVAPIIILSTVVHHYHPTLTPSMDSL